MSNSMQHKITVVELKTLLRENNIKPLSGKKADPIFK